MFGQFGVIGGDGAGFDEADGFVKVGGKLGGELVGESWFVETQGCMGFGVRGVQWNRIVSPLEVEADTAERYADGCEGGDVDGPPFPRVGFGFDDGRWPFEQGVAVKEGGDYGGCGGDDDDFGAASVRHPASCGGAGGCCEVDEGSRIRIDEPDAGGAEPEFGA